MLHCPKTTECAPPVAHWRSMFSRHPPWSPRSRSRTSSDRLPRSLYVQIRMLGLALTAVLVLLVLGDQWAFSPVQTVQAQSPVYKVYGLDFSPYLTGQDPNLGSQVSASQTLSRAQIAAPYTSWLRSFGSTNGLENIPSVARQLGLKVAANAWISSNTVQNTTEINSLIAAANAGLVDIAIVGSEAILRNDVTVSQLWLRT